MVFKTALINIFVKYDLLTHSKFELWPYSRRGYCLSSLFPSLEVSCVTFVLSFSVSVPLISVLFCFLFIFALFRGVSKIRLYYTIWTNV